MAKPTILLIKIKEPNKKLKVIEAAKKGGWSKKDISQFVKGVQAGYPEAKITTSTITPS